MNVHRVALIWMSILLTVAVAVLCQEPQPAAAASAEEAATVRPTEVQAYLGYWLLTMNLGQREAKMGLVLRADEGELTGRLVSPFGEMEASSFRRLGDGLGFDLRSGLGNFEVETRLEGTRMLGSFADQSGSLAADFTGSQSDRLAFQEFLVPANETRITRGEKKLRVRFATESVEHPDYARVATAEPGDVIAFTEDMAIKLMTDFDLRFGDATIRKENVAPGYPGVYSLWLARTEDGWSLVFNEQADVWGTQHDAAADVAAVGLVFEQAAEPSEQFSAKLETSESGHVLRFAWGPHRWSVPLEIVGGEGEEPAVAATDGS